MVDMFEFEREEVDRSPRDDFDADLEVLEILKK